MVEPGGTLRGRENPSDTWEVLGIWERSVRNQWWAGRFVDAPWCSEWHMTSCHVMLTSYTSDYLKKPVVGSERFVDAP